MIVSFRAYVVVIAINYSFLDVFGVITGFVEVLWWSVDF